MAVRLAAFAEALDAFSYLVSLDMDALAKTLEARLIDGLGNGKAQKFQYTIELCWKALKQALREQDGIDEASPKKVVKAWYLAGHLTDDDYVALLAAIVVLADVAGLADLDDGREVSVADAKAELGMQ